MPVISIHSVDPKIGEYEVSLPGKLVARVNPVSGKERNHEGEVE